MRTLTKELRDALTPQMTIDILRKGNERFVNNLKANRNLLQQVNETSEGQHKIEDAIEMERETVADRTSSNAAFVERVATNNVLLVKRQIIERSPIIGDMIRASEVALVGGMYDVDSGAVTFYDSQMVLGAHAHAARVFGAHAA